MYSMDHEKFLAIKKILHKSQGAAKDKFSTLKYDGIKETRTLTVVASYLLNHDLKLHNHVVNLNRPLVVAHRG